MKQYYYEFCELNIALQLPFPMQIYRSSENFCKEGRAEHSDVTFVYRAVDRLPKRSSRGHSISIRYYEETDDETRVFFRQTTEDAPYACVVWKRSDPTHYRCDYLKGTERWLNYSLAICDTLGIETLLLHKNALLLHSSFIRWQGQGILFSAPSGVGKSTQADLWARYAGAEILNGDRAGLRKKDGAWHAYGLPFAGSSQIYRNERAPIRAIVTLEQAPHNELLRLTPAQALRKLYPELTVHSWDAQCVTQALALAEDLITAVPVYLLRCRPDADAVRLVRRALESTEEKEC